MSPRPNLKSVSEVRSANPTMSIGGVIRTKKRTPDRIMLFGVPGVGKSTWAANAQRPIFISSEDGLSEIEAEAFPEARSFDDVLDAVDSLKNEEHPYQTVVIDTLDWVEALIQQDVKDKAKVDTIEDVGGGYGKGYTATMERGRLLISRMEQLVEKKPMEIICLAHAQIKNFSNPEGPDYARYIPKMNEKFAALFGEFSKSVLFACFETHIADAKDGSLVKGITSGSKKVKGFATGERVMRTVRTAAYEAKNRFALPPTLPLSYEAYAAARERFQATGILEQCVALIESLNLPAEHPARAFLQKHSDNPTELVRLLSRLESLPAVVPAT